MFITKFGSGEKMRRTTAFVIFYLFENVLQGGKFTPPPTEIQLMVDGICFFRQLNCIWGMEVKNNISKISESSGLTTM